MTPQHVRFSHDIAPLRRTGPRKAVLMENFWFMSKDLGFIDVEAGFDTDYASVPRIFWSIYPPDGSYTEAAVIHDALYWYQSVHGRPITRKQADGVFLEAMEHLGIPLHRRRILYRAVRLGGWVAWNKRAKEIQHEQS